LLFRHGRTPIGSALRLAGRHILVFCGSTLRRYNGPDTPFRREDTDMPVAPKRIIKEIRSLRHKKFRQEKQAYFAEGIAIVLSALENQAPVQYVIYSPELLRSETA